MSTSTTPARRALVTIGVLAATTVGLAGCIPMPPSAPPTATVTPEPSAPPAGPGTTEPSEPADPTETPEPGAGANTVEGQIPADGEGTATFTIDERSAVVLGAASPSGEDLALSMQVGDATIEMDDSDSIIDAFSFDSSGRNPTLALVLDAGDYTVTLTEYSGDATDFVFEHHASSTTIEPGSSGELEITDAPALAIVPIASGTETLSVESEIDTVMWAGVLGSGSIYMNDDGGGNLNPAFQLEDEQPQDIAVVLAAYGSETGPLTLTVE
ncbi:hypothetical protein [Agrococcus baldri]|uniref:Uncharacterized protein n=1 Tax=Agrococcus baldri TaxID=153730 RepID=A0AA87RA23_9MICO|nr:hypothetical protein [Agrococcus baldri]GEK79056.1 hypothetical protein ABA31_04070 [Agrococcus baldri]